MQYQAFATYYDKMMHDVDYDAWAAYLDGLIKQLAPKSTCQSPYRPAQASAPTTVLDCACGTGSLAIRLAKMGYSVIGSDLSEDMLFCAQRKARSSGLNLQFICQDLKGLAMHKQVDVINCACDGVNYLLSMAEVVQFLHSAHRCLTDGGLLLFDISSEHKLRTELGNRFMGERTDDYCYLWQNSYDEQNRLLLMELAFFVKDGQLYRRFDESHLQRAHLQQEIITALNDCGFEPLGCFEAFSTNNAKETDPRIQFAARKR